jgi:RNA polymerase sigma-70 factor (ECF subfamily)
MTDWDRLIDEHGPLVWRTVYRVLGHHGDAEDCFQATFLAAWKLDQREKVRNWPAALHRLAAARALECLRTRIRRRKVSGPSFDETFAAARQDPAEAAAEAELTQRLMEGIAELPSLQAEIVYHICIEGRTNLEVARLFELTPSRVGVELHRARQRLKRCINPSLDQTQDRECHDR